jgi:hypothetical protein
MAKDIKELQELPHSLIVPELTKGLSENIYNMAEELSSLYSQDELACLYKILYRDLVSLIDHEDNDKEIEAKCDAIRDDLDIFAFACTLETLKKATKEVLKELGE